MRGNKIPTGQVLVNRIVSKVEFTWPADEKLPDMRPIRLHMSLNPSTQYKTLIEDMYGAVKEPDSHIVTVLHGDGMYEILKYKKS